MVEQIKTYFPQVFENNCLWTSKLLKIFIFDQKDNKVIEVSKKERHHFVIENPNKKEIAILAIDKCVFDDQSKHQKCDLAIFDHQTFAFVEIKDTRKRRSDKKKSAKDQLEASIVEFSSKINFNEYRLFAVISWQFKRTFPAVSTQMQEAAFYFRSKYKVELVEATALLLNRKNFQKETY